MHSRDRSIRPLDEGSVDSITESVLKSDVCARASVVYLRVNESSVLYGGGGGGGGSAITYRLNNVTWTCLRHFERDN